MAVADSELLTVAKIKLKLYFTVKELEEMLANTKAGGYVAVNVETNGVTAGVEVEMK